MQWGQAMQAGDESLMHEVLHEERVSHHHEDDGTVHFDNSDESSQHIQDHSCSPQPAGLYFPVLLPAPTELIQLVSVDLVEFIPEPALRLPHRPPALALG